MSACPPGWCGGQEVACHTRVVAVTGLMGLAGGQVGESGFGVPRGGLGLAGLEESAGFVGALAQGLSGLPIACHAAYPVPWPRPELRPSSPRRVASRTPRLPKTPVIIRPIGLRSRRPQACVRISHAGRIVTRSDGIRASGAVRPSSAGWSLISLTAPFVADIGYNLDGSLVSDALVEYPLSAKTCPRLGARPRWGGRCEPHRPGIWSGVRCGSGEVEPGAVGGHPGGVDDEQEVPPGWREGCHVGHL